MVVNFFKPDYLVFTLLQGVWGGVGEKRSIAGGGGYWASEARNPFVDFPQALCCISVNSHSVLDLVIFACLYVFR